MPNEKYNAIAYLRLSREDNCEFESDSISNQRKLIMDFVSKHRDINISKELIDDGYSGTNMNRPAFQEMLQLVTDKKVNCVIVKDLSRFSRNYIDAGKLLELLFPSIGIRFIAINDNYDSVNSFNSNLNLEFKNIVNDIHARDLSAKIKTSLNAKRKNGELVASILPYGYKKSQLDKNKLVIDDEAALVVRQIFAWRIDGYSGQSIADNLNEQNVMPPAEYKRTHGTNFPKSIGVNKTWAVRTVNRMFENEMYSGNLVQGKTTKPYWNGTIIEKDKSEWDIKRNAHQAIVPQRILNATIKLSKRDMNNNDRNKRVKLFSGMLFCANCKENMVSRKAQYKTTVYPRYVCMLKNKGMGCFTQDYIKEKTLEDLILNQINDRIKQYKPEFDNMRGDYFGILDEENELYYSEHGQIKNLTMRILVLLIEKIYVYTKDKIEIVFTDWSI